ncbi:MAG: gamma-glutamylcyclotransferase family protein [Candidatus Xenobiia bacterium LiM19]
MIKYFAYGSCMNRKSFAETMKGHQYKELGIAHLNDYRLAFTRYAISRNGGFLDVIPSPGEQVIGVLYEISDEGKSRLRCREGYPNCYSEETIEVMLDGESCPCITYMVVDKAEKEFEPSEEYLQIVLEGMREHGLPEGYREKLVKNMRSIF